MINPINNQTWIASDHHFGHKNITEYETLRTIWKDLGYKSLEDMIIHKHNERVQPNDSVLFLGDFSWDSPQNWINKLNGNKYLVLGNHDRKSDISYKGFTGIFRGLFIGNGYEIFKSDAYIDPLLSALLIRTKDNVLVFSHYSIGYKDPYDHQSGEYINIRKKKILEVLSEYNCQKLPVINIHGHLHSHLAVDESTKGITYKNLSLEHTMFSPIKLHDVLSNPQGCWV